LLDYHLLLFQWPQNASPTASFGVRNSGRSRIFSQFSGGAFYKNVNLNSWVQTGSRGLRSNKPLFAPLFFLSFVFFEVSNSQLVLFCTFPVCRFQWNTLFYAFDAGNRLKLEPLICRRAFWREHLCVLLFLYSPKMIVFFACNLLTVFMFVISGSRFYSSNTGHSSELAIVFCSWNTYGCKFYGCWWRFTNSIHKQL
jgi:hypothetical protein